MSTDPTIEPDAARTERIVLTIGFLITYGATVFWPLFFSILAVGGEGEATGVYVIGSALIVAAIGCFFVSLRLAARRKHVRAILLGLIPIPLVVSVYGALALANALGLRGR